MSYYTPIMILVWLALVVLTILVIENDRLTKIQKHILFFTYAMVALAALAEWLGIQFNGKENVAPWVLKMIKFFDYILTPICGGFIVMQFRRNGIIQKIILIILGVNILFQFISLFFGWMTVIDETTHEYAHGPLYPVYISMYAVVVILAIIEFALYGRKYRKHNQVSLYGVLAVVAIGILLQELMHVKVAYMAITVGLALLFIHHNEFSQLEADDTIQEQMIKITVDPLSGILNRYAYEEALREIDMSEDLVIISIDINGLKQCNDTYGHKAGDELICGAASVISEVFKDVGLTYRIGGDEFIVIAYVDQNKLNRLLKLLDKRTEEWKGVQIDRLSLSTGYATMREFDHPSTDELVYTADQRMYKIKSDYYLARGIDRRRQ